MRDYLAPILAAIQTPPHMPKLAFEQARQQFATLERYFTGLHRSGAKVSDAIEGITGYSFRDPLWELPVSLRNIIEYMGSDKQSWEDPISNRIADLQSFMKFPNPSSETIGLILKRIARVDHQQEDYSDFFKAYANFLKEYPDVIKELQDVYTEAEQAGQLDEHWDQRLTGVSDLLQTYRSSLDAVYKYIQLYMKFARQVDAFILRRNLQMEAYYSGGAYPERTQRPPHKPVETLYHAGADVGSILAQGFKTRDELGEDRAALGGGPSDVISFTADIAIARGIVDALRYVIRIAHGEVTFEDVLKLARQDGVPDDKFDDVKRDYSHLTIPEDAHPITVKQFEEANRSRDPRRLAFEAYRVLIWFSDKRYDPVFFGVRVENFANMRVENVGILAAKVDMKQVTEYLREMEEFRAPKSAVLSMKKVPY